MQVGADYRSKQVYPIGSLNGGSFPTAVGNRQSLLQILEEWRCLLLHTGVNTHHGIKCIWRPMFTETRLAFGPCSAQPKSE